MLYIACCFWSLDEVVGNLRIHVRTCVRACVTLLLENRSLLFSETLQLIRAFNSEKNVPIGFLKIFQKIFENCPKLAIWLDVCTSLFKGWEWLGWGRKNDPKNQICVKNFFPYFCLKNIFSLLKIDFD